MVDKSVNYHRLENIEDVEEFYAAIDRSNLTKSLSDERPYTYWTIELYDQENGIRGGGGLGILAADTRRVADKMNVPLTLVTLFYPFEPHQTLEDGQVVDSHTPVSYESHGFSFIDTVNIKCCDQLCSLEAIEKRFNSTRILCVTEPNLGELYSGESGSDHRLYQEVALGFGGYQALKMVGLRPAIIQLNEVATFFAALARLDELASSGMDFYEAVVYTRKHTLYTNHTLVQAAEAEFSYDQFERYVFSNLKSKAVKKWLSDKFENGRIKLSSVTIEIAELRSGVSRLHARVANYQDIAGEKVKFKAVTNGIDLQKWLLPEILNFYQNADVLDKFYFPTDSSHHQIDQSLSSEKIRELKTLGRKILNSELENRTNHRGEKILLPENALVFDFKRRFVDYKRPWLPFSNPTKLKQILEKSDAYYILAARVHSGDNNMVERLKQLLQTVDSDPFLREHVHYIPDYDEKLAYALSVGSNVAINTPIVGLEACGTSWMKDVGNLNLLISTHDGGVADCPPDSYLNISGQTEEEEIASLYSRMSEATDAWSNDFDLEFLLKKQLSAYLPTISGTRMLKEYLNYLFPKQ